MARMQMCCAAYPMDVLCRARSSVGIAKAFLKRICDYGSHVDVLARNRVDNAKALLKSTNQLPREGLIAAVEGGVGWIPDFTMQGSQPPEKRVEVFAWVVIENLRTGVRTCSRSACFLLAPDLARLILEEGMELGDADDKVSGRTKSGQGTGTIGRLSGGALTRKAYYEEAAVCALLPFLNPEHYGEQYNLLQPFHSCDKIPGTKTGEHQSV
ncbi:inosine triphosphate pyrophosphatase-like protein [Dunaliella salina]|uniref:inosine/xanthosine triphosphatase n=1 Tax=Dunaliella salina TaxID=3046 RepID=A0ABQ7GF94_DUNSA|nr:inosine triphosphate pyrophosphatase-like protein [Dunaliella salina]|eukprot:KAF5833282.1 inosine triphosphate pyrophosphatase-like protein [Dunaliella salina]